MNRYSMKRKRKIYSIDNQNYLIDTDKHCLYDVESIGALKNGHRIFSCLIDDLDNNITVKTRKWGSVNENFEEVIPCKYECLSEYRENIYSATILNPTRTGECLDKYFYFLMDENGIPIVLHNIDDKGINKELIVRFESFIATSEFKQGLAVGLSFDRKQGGYVRMVVCS